MKTEKIMAAWSTATLAILGALPQLKHEGTKVALLSALTVFTICLFTWSILKKKSDDK